MTVSDDSASRAAADVIDWKRPGDLSVLVDGERVEWISFIDEKWRAAVYRRIDGQNYVDVEYPDGLRRIRLSGDWPFRLRRVGCA